MKEQSPRWYYSPWPLNLVLCAIVILLTLRFGNPLERLELKWFDVLLRVRAETGRSNPMDNRIVNVGITDADLHTMLTIEDEYKAAAEIIQKTSDLGAEVVTFDIIFERGDRVMAKPILDATEKTRVVLAESFPEKENQRQVRSFPFLEKPYTPAGGINVKSDKDGIYRHYDLVQQTLDEPKPSLALATYFAWRGIQWPSDIKINDLGLVTWSELSADGTKLESKAIPFRNLLLDFRGSWENVGFLTLEDLRNAHHKIFQSTAQGIPNERPLDGKIVIVGHVAVGTGDTGATAFEHDTPRVYLHSTALNDLLQNTFHRRTPRFLDALLLTSVLLLGMTAAYVRQLLPVGLVWVVGVGVLITISTVFVWKNQEWVPATVLAASLWTVCLIGEVTRRYAVEYIERRRLRSTFERCVSPEVLSKVLETPSIETLLAGSTLQSAILFFDIRGFSTAAEKLSATDLLKILNHHLELIVRSVMRHGGMVNNFIGDAVLAIFNCPLPIDDPAGRALRCAMDCQEELTRLNKEEARNDGVRFSFGAGINFGTVVAGAVGSSARFSYSVIGDEVNLAARLESLTRHYPVDTILSESLHKVLDTQTASRCIRIDRITVKGRVSPLDIFTISNFSADDSAHYTVALDQYLKGNFRVALEKFRERHSALHASMAKRCEELLQNSTPWPGHYIWESK